jgi:hypothetical protein
VNGDLSNKALFIARLSSISWTDTGTGALNFSSSRTNHSLLGTPFQAVGAPVEIEDHAAMVVDGRMLTGGVGVLVQSAALFIAKYPGRRGSLARVNLGHQRS